MPVAVLLAFALTSATSTGSPSSTASSTAAAGPVTVVAPTPSDDVVEPCAQLVSQLPVQLGDLAPRIAHPSPDTAAQVAAWGNPPIEFICGTSRPSALTVDSGAQVVNVDGVNWLPIKGKSSTEWVAIDRAVYVSVTVPASYEQPPLGPISDAVTATLPQVCHLPEDETAGSTTDVGPLCTHRS